jgi:hypothetical protein
MILIIFSYLKQTSTFHARMACMGKVYNAKKVSRWKVKQQ